MYWLILAFTLASTGEFSSIAVKFQSLEECEKRLPEARMLAETSRKEVGGYVVFCAKVESTGEPS